MNRFNFFVFFVGQKLERTSMGAKSSSGAKVTTQSSCRWEECWVSSCQDQLPVRTTYKEEYLFLLTVPKASVGRWGGCGRAAYIEADRKQSKAATGRGQLRTGLPSKCSLWPFLPTRPHLRFCYFPIVYSNSESINGLNPQLGQSPHGLILSDHTQK